MPLLLISLSYLLPSLIAYHDIVVVVGTVYVVDTSQSAGLELVAECTSDEYVHSEPVSQAWEKPNAPTLQAVYYIAVFHCFVVVKVFNN